MNPFTLWTSSVQIADLVLGDVPPRNPFYMHFVHYGHLIPAPTLYAQCLPRPNPDGWQAQVQPYESPMTGPMTSERWRIEKRLRELHEANVAEFKRRVVSDTRPVKDQVFEFCTLHKVHVTKIDNWRPVPAGTYTHRTLPLGSMRDGITDGTVAWMLVVKQVQPPLWIFGPRLVTVREAKLVQLANMDVKLDAPLPRPTSPDEPTKRRGRKPKFDPFDVI